jgi:hypothetical protein
VTDGVDAIIEAAADAVCDVKGCAREWRRETPTGRHLCSEHYDRWAGDTPDVDVTEVPAEEESDAPQT